MSQPNADFYVTGGTLRHDAPSYIRRHADAELRDALLRSEFCYVLTPRQMGKSSLMVRTAAALREQGVRTAVLDLNALCVSSRPFPANSLAHSASRIAHRMPPRRCWWNRSSVQVGIPCPRAV
jgi:hypothetical protein